MKIKHAILAIVSILFLWNVVHWIKVNYERYDAGTGKYIKEQKYIQECWTIPDYEPVLDSVGNTIFELKLSRLVGVDTVDNRLHRFASSFFYYQFSNFDIYHEITTRKTRRIENDNN